MSNDEEPHAERSQIRVLLLVRSLVVLSFLGSASGGVLIPVLPILMTEVWCSTCSFITSFAWIDNA